MRFADRYPLTLNFVFLTVTLFVLLLSIFTREYAATLLALVLIVFEGIREPWKADR